MLPVCVSHSKIYVGCTATFLWKSVKEMQASQKYFSQCKILIPVLNPQTLLQQKRKKSEPNWWPNEENEINIKGRSHLNKGNIVDIDLLSLSYGGLGLHGNSPDIRQLKSSFGTHFRIHFLVKDLRASIWTHLGEGSIQVVAQ